jgi:hypothetical protein
VSIVPADVAFFVPGHLKAFKLDLFNRVGATIEKAGGRVVRGNTDELRDVAQTRTPIVGCTPELRPLIDDWIARKRPFGYWDRGYFRRVFATWLPRGEAGGYYRWALNAYQARTIRDVPDDRWRAMRIDITPWSGGGRHIVVAAPTTTYARFHVIEGWIERTLDELAKHTDRQVVIRCKEAKRPLQADLNGAHALVAHGSIAAVEAVICGCPVFVHPDSAAALVGLTDLSKIERPVYPDREPWVRSLAYAQFNERELVDGTLWKLLG